MNIFFVYTRSQKIFANINFIEKLSKFHEFNIFIYLSSNINKETLNIFKKLKLKIFDFTPQLKKNDNKIKLKSLKLFLRNFTFYQIILEYRHTQILKKKYNYAKKTLLDNNINILFVLSDRDPNDESAFVKAAIDMGIKIIIPYYSILAEYSVMIKSKKNNNIHSIYDFYMNRKYKKYKYLNKDFYPFYIINSLKKFGNLSSNPWIIGSGFSDIICCNNKLTFNQYLDSGVPEKKLKIIGDIIYDDLYFNYKNKKNNISKFIEVNKLNKEKKIIIIALPQLAEDNIMSWEKHWEEIEFLCNTLMIPKCNLIVSLHPKMKIEKYIFLEKKYNLKITTSPLSSIIHYADLFVASYSSTVYWSLMCKISTIVVDFYNLKRLFFNPLHSLKIIEDKKKFVSIIKNSPFNHFIDEKDLELLSFQKTFDGNVINRYVNLIRELKNE